MPLPWTTALIPEGVIVAALGGHRRRPARRPVRLRAARRAAHSPDGAVCLRRRLRPHHRRRPRRGPPRGAGRAGDGSPHGRAAGAQAGGDRDRQAAPGGRRRRCELALHARLAGPRAARRRPAPAGRRGRVPVDEADPAVRTWKVGLRLNRGYERGAVPVRLPVDAGLPHATQHIPAVVRATSSSARCGAREGPSCPRPRASPARSATTT